MGLLEALGDRELPDSRPNAIDRKVVKRVVAVCESRWGSDELMFAAEAFDSAARRKHAGEEAGRS